MKLVRISSDVWVNLDQVESVTRNVDGTALIQGRNRVYESVVPIEAIVSQLAEQPQEQITKVESPLMSLTTPAW